MLSSCYGPIGKSQRREKVYRARKCLYESGEQRREEEPALELLETRLYAPWDRLAARLIPT